MEESRGKIRSIKVYGKAFELFYNNQPQKVRDRILWVLRLIRDIQFISNKYLKHVEGTDGIYEIRISSGNNIFRIFCFFDEGQLIILLNGFHKKTMKTPTGEIEKAKRLKKQFYEDKKK